MQQPTIVDIQKLVAAHFPELTVNSFQRTSLGNINWVYFVETAQKRLVVKVVYRKDREEQEILAKEAEIIQKLNQQNIKGVPKLYAFDPSQKLAPFIYLIEEYLPGEPFISQEKKLKQADLPPIIKEMAEYMTALQQIKLAKITEFEKTRPEFTSFKDYVEKFAPKYYQVAVESKKLDQKLCADSLDFIKEKAGKIQDTSFVLAHSDISSHNILLDDHNQMIGVIDYEAAQTLTPEYDLVTSYHEFLHRYPGMWNLLLQEYVKMNKIPPNFKERLNIIMGYRAWRYLYVAIKNQIWQYLPGDIKRMEEVLDGSFSKTIKI